eukprot:TRINITY_DN1097_c4_g1_i1.p1 TRINITY_DN1097_c4_g1~~TRINITY_DN1097_c4_g1_i1.p1  ORF type:complete len:586 (+),score=56.60 TRINITY_DN1097_c4_g1_i1:44-1759(+)
MKILKSILLCYTLTAATAAYLDKLNALDLGVTMLSLTKGKVYGLGERRGVVLKLGKMDHHPVRPAVENKWTVDTDADRLWVDHDEKVALVAAGEDGMVIYSINEDKIPEKVKTFTVRRQEGATTCVAKYKNYAYMFLHASEPKPQSSVVIADVTDVSHPFFLTKMNLEGKVVSSVIVERTLHAITKAGRIYSFDITRPKVWTPISKVIVGTDDDPLEGRSLDCFRDFLYIGAGDRVFMYLLKTGEPPIYVSDIACESTVNSVVWFRGYLYVATVKGLFVVDVRDPAKPRKWGFRETLEPARSVVVIEFTALLATRGMLEVIDVLPPKVQDVPLEIAISALERARAPKRRTLPPKTPMPTPEPTPEPPPPETPSPPTCGLVLRFGTNLLDTKKREVYSGVKLWPSIVGSKLVNVPSWLTGAQFVTPNNLPVPVDTMIEFGCCSEICDLFIILDLCSNCPSSANGGLIEVLLQEGWSMTYCSPLIFLSHEDPTIPTVAFRKQVSHSEVQTLSPVPRMIPLISFAVVEREARCSEIENKERCGADAFCTWIKENETCRPAFERCNWSHLYGKAV